MANDADYSDEMPNIDPTPNGDDYNGRYLPPGPGYNLAPPTADGLDRPLVPEIPGLPPDLQPYGNGPGFADGPPISGPQYEGNRGTIEDFLRDMLESARPPPRPMLDEQIPGDVTPRQPSRDSRMPQINPEMGPPVQWTDPGFGPQLHTVNPHVRMDEGMDQMEEDPSHIWKYNTGKIDNAEQMVQDMIQMRMKNMKFR